MLSAPKPQSRNTERQAARNAFHHWIFIFTVFPSFNHQEKLYVIKKNYLSSKKLCVIKKHLFPS
jgi:hypothetical protein